MASRSAVTGQLTASSLNGIELEDLVVALDLEDEGVWRVDSQAREIVINNENDSVRIVSPRFENQSMEDSRLIQQLLEIPRVEFLAQDISVYMDNIELDAESESVGDSQLINSGGHFSVTDIGAYGTAVFDDSLAFFNADRL